MIRDFNYDEFTRIGEEFGENLSRIFGSHREITVTVSHTDDNYAYCRIYADDEPLPIPLSLFNVEGSTAKITPKDDSIINICFSNGDENTPFITGYSIIDKIEYKRNKIDLLLSVDSEDETKDNIKVKLGDSIIDIVEDKITVSIGDSTMTFTSDLIEFNGGSLSSLVVIGQLTERLNKLKDEINKVQQSIQSHGHTYIDSVGQAATPVVKNTLTTKYSNVTLTAFEDKDYENKKITQ